MNVNKEKKERGKEKEEDEMTEIMIEEEEIDIMTEMIEIDIEIDIKMIISKIDSYKEKQVQKKQIFSIIAVNTDIVQMNAQCLKKTSKYLFINFINYYYFTIFFIETIIIEKEEINDTIPQKILVQFQLIKM